jgi:hypothetical protein
MLIWLGILVLKLVLKLEASILLLPDSSHLYSGDLIRDALQLSVSVPPTPWFPSCRK